MSRRTRLWYGAWAVYSVALGVLYTILPLYVDHDGFDYLGGVCLGGGLPYIDAADQNFPGMIYVHALALALFGFHSWSFRLFDYLMLLGFVAILGRTVARRQGTATVLVFIPLYQIIYVTSGTALAGQRDIIAIHLCLVAGALVLGRIDGGRLVLMVLAGLAVFYAALIKPTYVFMAPALPLIDLVGRRQSNRTLRRIALDHAVTATTMVAAAAALLLIGWRLGILGAWYECTVTFNATIYAHPGRRPSLAQLAAAGGRIILTWWPAYLAVATVGGLLWIRRGDRSLFVLLLAALSTSLASAFIQGKMFGYHLVPILPVLALLMAEALGWAFQTLAAARPAKTRAAGSWAVAALLLLLTALAIGKKTVGVYRMPVAWQLGLVSREEYLAYYNLLGIPEVVAFIQERTGPEETVWTFSDNIAIYNLARRRSPSRFCHPIAYLLAAPPFPGAARWQAEIVEILRNHPPKLIIMCLRKDKKYKYEYLNEEYDSPLVSVFARMLAQRYRLVKSINQLDIYELI